MVHALKLNRNKFASPVQPNYKDLTLVLSVTQIIKKQLENIYMNFEEKNYIKKMHCWKVNVPLSVKSKKLFRMYYVSKDHKTWNFWLEYFLLIPMRMTVCRRRKQPHRISEPMAQTGVAQGLWPPKLEQYLSLPPFFLFLHFSCIWWRWWGERSKSSISKLSWIELLCSPFLHWKK